MNPSKLQPSSKKHFLTPELIGVLLLLSLVGWFLLWPAFQNVRDSFTVRSWPTTTARVIKSTKTTSSNGSGRIRDHYRFEYEYNVDGEAFTGWRYSLSYPSGSQRRGVKLHKEDDMIRIHYHPHHPSRSVVDAEASAWWNYLTLGVATFLSLTWVLVKYSPNFSKTN